LKKEFLYDINIIINNEEIIEIIKRFPKEYQEDFNKNIKNNENIIDFVFDFNKMPYVVLSKGTEKKIFFSEKKVTGEFIQEIIKDLFFLDNNRSGIDDTLHRVSIKKNVKDEIDGITIRVGRSIIGISSILDDIIDQNKSILFLGFKII
jgi:stage III sporulation protein SpoIIIAA